MHGERERLLLEAVARLQEREREVVALKFGGELSNAQIAEIMQLSPGNVGVILYRTMKQLRAMLDAKGVSE